MDTPKSDGVTEDLAPLITTRTATAVYARTPRPLVAVSGSMATALIVAGICTAAGAIITITHAASPVVPDPVLGLTYVCLAVSWTAAVQIAVRDRQDRRAEVLRADIERVQARQVELYRRQDHATVALAAIRAGQQDLAAKLDAIAADVAKIREGVSDALEISDADAELNVRRQQVQQPAGGRPRLVTSNSRPS